MKSKHKIMGVLNLTPDSFSDGGKFFEVESAKNHFFSMLDAGADIVDVGAESTGPNSKVVSEKVEIERLSEFFSQIQTKGRVISVDTYKSKVAKWALEQGVSIINDVSGLRASPDMADVISAYKSKVVIMYSRMSERFPHSSKNPKEYDNLLDDISSFFDERISYALSKGIDENNIILDPGMGSFLSPNGDYSWQLIGHASELKERYKGFPLLYAVSRKGFIKDLSGKANLDFITKVIELDLINAGVDIIRTHEVPMLINAVNAVDKIRVPSGKKL